MKKLIGLLETHKYNIICCGFLGLIVFYLQGHLLFTSQYVISEEHHDIHSLFYYLQDMAQEGLRQGHIVKWNPYMFGGMPFLGEGQEMQLYPIRWLLCIFPTAQALNWYFFLHVWLLGVNMFAWMRFKGLHPIAALVAGTAIMLCGPFFLHQVAGHIVLGTYSWTPLVFLGIDGWLQKRNFGWILLAAAAAALQIYTGFTQIFYLTALFAGLYSLFNLWNHKRVISSAAGLIVIYPIALLLSAAQFLPSLGATMEGVRSQGLAYDYPIGLPAENVILTFAPWFFGGNTELGYWGRSAGFHEVLPHFGCVAIFLAAIYFYQATWAERAKRLFLIAIPMLLALAAATPLHKLAYDYIPMYSLFRAAFRPTFISAVFVALSAAEGLHYILRQKQVPKSIIVLFASFGIVCVAIGATITTGTNSWFYDIIRNINTAPYHYYQTILDNADKMAAAALLTSKSLIIAGAWMLALSTIGLFASGIARKWLIPACCIAELVIFAAPSVRSIPISKTKNEALALFRNQNPGDYRTVFGFECKYIGLKAEGLWGYNPVLMRRYAELLFNSQGENPDNVSMDINIRKSAKTWDLLRVKYAMVNTASGTSMQLIGNPMPRFFMARNVRVMNNRNEILNTLESPAFDLRNEVILEQKVDIPRSDTPIQENIKVVKSTTDQWILDVTIDRPGVLVMTDAYSNGWKAKALRGSVQANYNLQPADYALRGIPLQAGNHKILIEYIPWGYRAGLAITGLSLIALILLFAIPRLRAKLAPNLAPKTA